MPAVFSKILPAALMGLLLTGCAGGPEATLQTAAVVSPEAAPAAVVTPAVAHSGGALPVTTVAATSPPPASTPAAPTAKPEKKKKDKLGGFLSSRKPIQTGTMKPDGSYEMSEAELAMDCKKLTGRASIRIMQIRDYQLTQKSTAVARGMQQAVTPLFGGTGHGVDPDADYRRDRAMVEAYNKRLAEKRCKTFDLVQELQPKPAGESPTPVRKK